jgi:hypothetical protein
VSGVLEGVLLGIKFDASEVAAVGQIWRKAGADMPEAMAQTLNRVGPVITTRVRRQLAKQIGLPYGRIKDETSNVFASVNSLIFDIRSRGRPIPLREFAARETRKGVRARPWGVSRLFAGTFMAETPGGNVEDVYKRIGGRREWRTVTDPETGKTRRYQTELPIEKLYGPAIPKEMVRGGSAYVFQVESRDRLPTEAQKQVDKILRQGRLAVRKAIRRS